MRRFIDKNRVKRKYTRKNQMASSLLLSKELLMGFAPIVLIAVLLTVTLFIAQFFRDQHISLQFTFVFPQSYVKAFIQFFVTLGTQLLAFLNPLPLFSLFQVWWGIYIHACLAFINFVLYCNYFIQSALVYAFFSGLFTFVSFLVSLALQSYNVVVQGCFVVTQSFLWLVQTIVTFVLTCIQALSHAISVCLQVCFQFILLIITKFVTFIDQVFYNLGAPFRVLSAFYGQIKPYLDYFLLHVQMTGADFSKGLHSFITLGGLTTQH